MKPTKYRRRGLLGDMWLVIKRDRKFWLLPLIIVLIVVLTLMVVAAASGPLAPFIYPLL
ncbi:MAG TPA: DUF5989 family protein [Thermoanaerobaculia bacterium]|nr:DUF5989 family protein [Thermoanaerobaculia bacterium]